MGSPIDRVIYFSSVEGKTIFAIRFELVNVQANVVQVIAGQIMCNYCNKKIVLRFRLHSGCASPRNWPEYCSDRPLCHLQHLDSDRSDLRKSSEIALPAIFMEQYHGSNVYFVFCIHSRGNHLKSYEFRHTIRRPLHSHE